MTYLYLFLCIKFEYMLSSAGDTLLGRGLRFDCVGIDSPFAISNGRLGVTQPYIADRRVDSFEFATTELCLGRGMRGSSLSACCNGLESGAITCSSS